MASKKMELKKMVLNRERAQEVSKDCHLRGNAVCPVCLLDGRDEWNICCAFCTSQPTCEHCEYELWKEEGCLLWKAAL